MPQHSFMKKLLPRLKQALPAIIYMAIYLTWFYLIENMKGRSIQVGAYFFDSYGNPVKANNVPMQYRTRDGQLCSGSQAYVKYESTSWEDYKLFIPHGYFRDGEYSCAVQISSNRGIVLAISDSVSFTKSSY